MKYFIVYFYFGLLVSEEHIGHKIIKFKNTYQQEDKKMETIRIQKIKTLIYKANFHVSFVNLWHPQQTFLCK